MISTARTAAVMRKEFAEFRRNRFIVTTAGILPTAFLVSPTVSVLSINDTTASTALSTRVEASLFLPLLVPVFVPSMLAAFGIAGEREQGTLEPVLTTPLRRAELLTGKALAIFLPSLVISYALFGLFFAVTQLFAAAPAAAAVRHAPQLSAALVFIPLLAAWAIWAGLAISTCTADTRVAYQLSVLSSLPPVAILSLMSFNLIQPALGTAAAFAGGLLLVDCTACLAVSRLFVRERLITGTRS
jgi:ABC-type transport system involved in multi-copper enzyme maturation permease subunit